MQRSSLMIVLPICLGLVGCGPSAAEKLLGKWRYDVTKAMRDTMEEQQGPQPGQPTLLGFMDALGMNLEVEVHFKEDGTLKLSAGGDGKWEMASRTWEVVGVDGQKLTLELGRLDDGETVTREITFLDDDHLEFAPPGLQNHKLVFARVKEDHQEGK